MNKFISTVTRSRFPQFFIVGVCGVAINLGVTWLLTAFVFGLSGYFLAYLWGIAANLTFNFILYSIIFGTKEGHVRRLAIFITYSLVMTFVQANVVRIATPMVGLRFYLFVIASTIFVFAVVNFFVFKLSIFKTAEHEPMV